MIETLGLLIGALIIAAAYTYAWTRYGWANG